MQQKEKILTEGLVDEFELNTLKVITSDILESYTSIEKYAFYVCISITSITIPNSITSIGDRAFYSCSFLTFVNLPNSIVNIGNDTFAYCNSLIHINIPNSIKRIGNYAFYACDKLTNIIIGDKTYETQKVVDGKCKAYKAFRGDMTCRGFQYKKGKTYEIEGEPKLCKWGFHACLNLKDVFIYYFGEIGKDIVVHEVELEGVSDERNNYDSKVVAKKITIGKRIL